MLYTVSCSPTRRLGSDGTNRRLVSLKTNDADGTSTSMITGKALRIMPVGGMYVHSSPSKLFVGGDAMVSRSAN